MGQGEPVVLLHAIPSWSNLWTVILESLTRVARVLAPDAPGPA
jgi:pimeloyl-ACP methyl ester carboxylesterase